MMARIAALVLVFLAAAPAVAVDVDAVQQHWRLAQAYLGKGLRQHALDEARVVLRLDPAHAGAKALVDSGGLAPVTPVAAATPPAGVAPAARAGAATPTNLVAEATKAYRESRVEDAKRLADEVLVAEPGNADAARILRNLEEEVYQPSPLGVNDVLRDLFEKGIALYRAEAWDDAAGVFQQALAASPTHDQSRSFFARCRTRAEDAGLAKSFAAAKDALAAGRVEEAKAALRNVLAIRPDHAEAKALLESIGAGPQAEERKRQAKEHFNRGVEAYEQGRWADSIREWELVTTLDPADEEAKKLLRKARAKDTAAKKEARRRIPAMHEDALRLYQQGKLEEARKLYRQILDLDPGDEKAKRSLELIDGRAGP
jgi:tetratricopeptide (TPR) repeat protein